MKKYFALLGVLSVISGSVWGAESAPLNIEAKFRKSVTSKALDILSPDEKEAVHYLLGKNWEFKTLEFIASNPPRQYDEDRAETLREPCVYFLDKDNEVGYLLLALLVAVEKHTKLFAFHGIYRAYVMRYNRYLDEVEAARAQRQQEILKRTASVSRGPSSVSIRGGTHFGGNHHNADRSGGGVLAVGLSAPDPSGGNAMTLNQFLQQDCGDNAGEASSCEDDPDQLAAQARLNALLGAEQGLSKGELTEMLSALGDESDSDSTIDATPVAGAVLGADLREQGGCLSD